MSLTSTHAPKAPPVPTTTAMTASMTMRRSTLWSASWWPSTERGGVSDMNRYYPAKVARAHYIALRCISISEDQLRQKDKLLGDDDYVAMASFRHAICRFPQISGEKALKVGCP